MSRRPLPCLVSLCLFALFCPSFAQAQSVVLFDSILDYSYAGRPDLLWGFPTRGYDDANDPVSQNTAPNGTDSLIATPDAHAAQLTLYQVGQSVSITGITIHGGLVDRNGYFTAGSIALLFFDGVYDGPGGLPFSGSGAAPTQKLAATANGTNAYIVKIPLTAQTQYYTITFGATGPTGSLFPVSAGMQQPMPITDPQGRFGVMIAAVPNDAYGSIWAYLQGAPNGLNRAYIYQNYLFTAAAKVNGTGGYTAVLAPNKTGTPGSILTSSLIPGHTAIGTLTDGDLNAGKIVPGTGTTPDTAPYLPLNPWITFYGKKRDGTALQTGELRGRIRNLGFDPDSPVSNTFVSVSTGGTLPGERRANRYRFTFITPPINTTQVQTATLWDTTQLPAGYSIAYQQEFYAQPSFGLNDDGSNASPVMANTPVKLNYRLRGIPVGTYSLLAQQIPVYGTVTQNGTTTLVQDSGSPLDLYPGADHVGAFIPLVTIPSSIAGGTSFSPDSYTNPVTLDIKLRLQADMTGFTGFPDGVVDTADFNQLVGDFSNTGLPGELLSDICGGAAGEPDGVVDTSDFNLLIGSFANGDQIQESNTYP